MSVRHLLGNVDSAELTEWMAYFKIENERMEKSARHESDMPVEDKIKTALHFPGAKVR